VNVPSFMVRVDSQKHIDFALNSPFGGGREGRVKRRNMKVCPAAVGVSSPPSDAPSHLQNAAKKEGGGGDDAEEEE
jgi:hypothetical protein